MRVYRDEILRGKPFDRLGHFKTVCFGVIPQGFGHVSARHFGGADNFLERVASSSPAGHDKQALRKPNCEAICGGITIPIAIL